MAMLDDIIDGLEVLKTYDAKAPLVTQAYYLSVPAIVASSVSGPDQATLAGLNWLINSEYDYYYYKGKTITEIKDITGD